MRVIFILLLTATTAFADTASRCKKPTLLDVFTGVCSRDRNGTQRDRAAPSRQDSPNRPNNDRPGDDGDNGHGNDPGKRDPSNPGRGNHGKTAYAGEKPPLPR
ncbi:hypothetical protein [Rhizobium phage RHph_X2_24]|nr:hypothetical protein [Rhizobium phage RHph_X2_24]